MPLKRQHQNTDSIDLIHDEHNKRGFSLLSKIHPTHASPGARCRQKCSRLFQENFLTVQTGDFFSVLDKLRTVLRLTEWLSRDLSTITTGCCATSLNWGRLEQSTIRQMDRDEATVRTDDAQLTEEAQGGLSLRKTMRHPKLRFWNLWSPTASGTL